MAKKKLGGFIRVLKFIVTISCIKVIIPNDILKNYTFRGSNNNNYM